MNEQTLGTTTLVHVGIVVSDIEAKVREWADLLGLPKPRITVTDRVDVAHTEYRGKATQARARIASFRLGQAAVELIEPLGGPSAWKDQLDRHGDSLHHIAFRVEGMEDRVAFLESKGIPLVQSGDFTGGRYVYVDGASLLGTALELMERLA